MLPLNCTNLFPAVPRAGSAGAGCHITVSLSVPYLGTSCFRSPFFEFPRKSALPFDHTANSAKTTFPFPTPPTSSAASIKTSGQRSSGEYIISNIEKRERVLKRKGQFYTYESPTLPFPPPPPKFFPEKVVSPPSIRRLQPLRSDET